MTKDLSQIAIETIKKTGMKPAPKIKFYFGKILFWSLVGIAILVGSLSFAIIIFLLINNDWHLYNKFGTGFILKTLPYFWLIFLAIFIFLGEYYYKKTTFGYRRRFLTIITAYIIITVLFGSMIYMSGLGESLENRLYKNIPLYRSMMFNQKNIWSQPQKGLLSGTILSNDVHYVEIIDFNSKKWNVNIDNAIIHNKVELSPNQIIKIIGTNQNNNWFYANEIRPWMNKRRAENGGGGMIRNLR